MKKTTLLLALAVLVLAACESKKPQTAATGEAKAVDTTTRAAAQSLTIDTAASQLTWKAGEGLLKVLTAHNGTIPIQSGTLAVEDGKLTGGKFGIGVASLAVLDLPAGSKKNADLVGHLKNADFFDVVKFPTATFELVSAEQLPADSLRITGNLTMHGVTKSVTFPARVAVTDAGVTAVADFNIDRTQWGMTFHSDQSLGKELIRPEVGIGLKLVARP